jgi:hypothetical protein
MEAMGIIHVHVYIVYRTGCDFRCATRQRLSIAKYARVFSYSTTQQPPLPHLALCQQALRKHLPESHYVFQPTTL